MCSLFSMEAAVPVGGTTCSPTMTCKMLSWTTMPTWLGTVEEMTLVLTAMNTVDLFVIIKISNTPFG